jgi:hypothetical protein
MGVILSLLGMSRTGDSETKLLNENMQKVQLQRASIASQVRKLVVCIEKLVGDRLADLVRKVSIRSMGPIAHPSMRESSLATSRGAATIRNAGYTTGKDLLVDAVVVVLEGYLTRVRVDTVEYVSYAEVTAAQVKPFVCSLVSIYKMPVPKNDGRSSMDLARTVLEILRRISPRRSIS